MKRKILHYSISSVVVTFYGIKVCPYLDSLSPLQVFIPFFVLLTIQFLVSSFLIFPRIEKSPLHKQVRAIFTSELILFLVAGLIITVFNMVVYGFPVVSGLKVMVGLSLMGFFIAIDLALLKEYEFCENFSQTGRQLDRIDFKMGLAFKLIIFAGISHLLVSLVFFLVISKDLDWLVEVGREISLKQAQRSILIDVGFVVGVALLHVLNIILSYTRNFKAFIKSENSVLFNASEGDFEARVPVSSNDELGIMAQKTNEMVQHLKTRNLELRESIERLRKSEADLSRSQRIANLGSWVWEIQSGNLQWSDEIFRIFGMKPGEIEPTYEQFLDIIHPEDREKVSKAVQEAIDHNRLYQIEHRIVLKDDTHKIVHEQGELEYNQAGQAIRMIGTVLDVTNIKKLESTQAIYRQVFERAIEGIVITDKKSTILYVNPAFTKITEYKEEDVLGRQINLLKSNHHDQEFYRGMWGSIQKKGQWEGEIWNRRKGGEIYPEWLTITQVHDQLSNEIQFVGVFHDLTDLKRSEEKVKYQENYDALTGLPNRVVFRDRLEQTLPRVDKKKEIVAILLLNIDRFQKINESLGFNVGDNILVSLGERLKTLVGQSDTLCRWGGDEFAFLLRDLGHVHDCIHFIQRISEQLKEPFRQEGDLELYLTTSIGVTIFPLDSENSETLIKNADTAKTKAKELGGNTYQLFTSSMNQRAMERIKLETNLRKAIMKQEFQVYFQPKVDMNTGQMVGAEALVRWLTEDGKMVSPADFIPMAEETGLIVEIGEIVIHQTCQQIQKWRKKGLDRISVGINLSARQFQVEDLARVIREILASYQADPKSIEFEVTESLVMQDMNKTIGILEELRQDGYKISMDDFGTGYSSLSYLVNFPIDVLKIDQAFVRDIQVGTKESRLVEVIVDMGHSLGLKVIAEGVETIEHVDFLKASGCDQIQGFYFSRPLPAKDFVKLLEKSPNLYEMEKIAQT